MHIRRLTYWLPPLLYAALIFYLSSQPDPFPSVAPLLWDKAVHASEYALLALLLCRALRSEGLSWTTAISFAIVLASAYGGSDEWHQLSVPMRSSDRMDWVADTIGGLTGSLAYYSVSRRWHALAGPRPVGR